MRRPIKYGLRHRNSIFLTILSPPNNTPVQRSEKWLNKEKGVCRCGRERSFHFALLNIGIPFLPSATHLMGQLGTLTFGYWTNPIYFNSKFKSFFWDSLCCIFALHLDFSLAALEIPPLRPYFLANL